MNIEHRTFNHALAWSNGKVEEAGLIKIFVTRIKSAENEQK
jgi:hypothetical protein